MLLDRVAPEGAYEQTDTRTMAAAPGDVFAALQQIAPGELPTLGHFFRLVGPVAPFKAGKPLYAQMLDAGFVVMGVTPLREVVLARPAKLLGLFRPEPRVKNRRELAAFDTPGHVKVALGFSLRAASEGEATSVTAALRMWPVEDRSARRLRLVWPLLRAGGGVFSRAWLKALAERTRG